MDAVMDTVLKNLWCWTIFQERVMTVNQEMTCMSGSNMKIQNIGINFDSTNVMEAMQEFAILRTQIVIFIS